MNDRPFIDGDVITLFVRVIPITQWFIIFVFVCTVIEFYVLVVAVISNRGNCIFFRYNILHVREVCTIPPIITLSGFI